MRIPRISGMILPAVVLALLFWNLPGRAGHGGEKAHRGHPAAVQGTVEHGQHADHNAGHQGEEHGGGTVNHQLEHHLCDATEVELPGFTLPGFTPFSFGGLEFPVTKHVYFLWAAALLLIVITQVVRRSYRDGVPQGALANFVEAVVVFIRDEVVLPSTGPKGEKYLGFFISTFMFILVLNLSGMVPWGATATGNISVTTGLALVAFFMIHWSGIREYGVFRHFANLVPHGVPVALFPIIIPIEILGMFTKPFALAIRLFANMLAGHAVITTFLALIPATLVGMLTIGPTAVAGSVAISLLELFVAFLQAYIFTMLTALFVGGSLNPH